jgi:hypothetical protein
MLPPPHDALSRPKHSERPGRPPNLHTPPPSPPTPMMPTPPWPPMPRYNPVAETIHIISHNVNRSTIVIDALLNSVGATADIILIQEANITDPQC